MTDIAKRLAGMAWPPCTEGAEEIKRLREQIETLKNQVRNVQAVNQKLLHQIASFKSNGIGEKQNGH